MEIIDLVRLTEREPLQVLLLECERLGATPLDAITTPVLKTFKRMVSGT